MIPQKEINVLDEHDGFTCITKLGTLWRPSEILKNGTMGILTSYEENSFYQTNDDVTMAIYKVKGYIYPIAIWFDNRTGIRIN